MCEKSGRVVMELSAGKLGYKGAAKRTRLVAVQLGRRVGAASYSKNYRKLTVYLRGRISMLVRGVVQGLSMEGVSIRRLVYVREIAHNGVRLRKSRRM
jgi:ribosomal protein S11